MTQFNRPYLKPLFRKADRGAGLVEYAVIVGLIGVTAIAAVSSTGEEVEENLDVAASEVEMAHLLATAERRIILPDGAKFPAQSCMTGSSLAETVDSGDGGPGDIHDCYDLKGGGDTLDLRSGPSRNIATYVAAGANQTFLPDGSHWVMFGSGGSGRDQITFSGGSARIVATGFPLADLSVVPQSERLRIESSSGVLDLMNAFTNPSGIGSFHFSDQVLSFSQMKDYAVSSQSSDANDTITGTALNDVIRPMAGTDTIIAFAGDDRIIYDQGDKLLIGDRQNAEGFDILDLTKYTASQVSISNPFGTMEIVTPDGTVYVYSANATPTNIERIEFSDGVLNYDDFPTE